MERKGYVRRGGYFEIITVAGISTSSFCSNTKAIHSRYEVC